MQPSKHGGKVEVEPVGGSIDHGSIASECFQRKATNSYKHLSVETFVQIFTNCSLVEWGWVVSCTECILSSASTSLLSVDEMRSGDSSSYHQIGFVLLWKIPLKNFVTEIFPKKIVTECWPRAIVCILVH